MKSSKTWVVVLVFAFASLSLISPVPATAESGNAYSISGLSEYVSGRPNFTVEIKGDQAVCQMSYSNTTLKSGPWTFAFDPQFNPGISQYLVITTCDGWTDWVSVDSKAKWYMLEDVINGESLGQPKSQSRVSVYTKSEGKYSVTIADASGRIVGRASELSGNSGDINFRLTSTAPIAKYLLTVNASEAGETTLFPLTVTRKFVGQYSTYDRCSTVYWNYDSSLAPIGATDSKMRADIIEGLARLSKKTALRFIEAVPGEKYDQTLRFEWGNTAKFGVGPNVAVGGNDTVTFNTKVQRGMALDKIAGFKRGGRGWIVVHEVMHVLGFGHTTDKNQVMYERGSWFVSDFGVGDLAGLDFLYQPKTCGT